MTAEDYAKVIEAALTKHVLFGPLGCTFNESEWYGVVHPVALRAMLEERKAMLRRIEQALAAWDTTPLPTSGDGMLQERMEDLRAHLTTTADNQPEGEA